MTSGVQGEQDVLLVHAGEGRERAAGGQTLLVEQLAVGAVAVDNGCRRQLFRQKLTALQTFFDDLDRNAGIEQDPREEKGDLAAADEHGGLDRRTRHADLVEEELLLLRGDNDRDVVARVQNEVALGDIGLVAAADHAQQHIGAQKGIDLAYRHALQTGLSRNADVEQLDAAACERADADRRRKTYQTGNDAGGRKLGIDRHGNTELVADKAEIGHILRITHARDRMAVGSLSGDQTGEKVDLVVCRDRDDEVGVLHARLEQNLIACAAAGNSREVETVGQLLQTPFGQVDERQIMPLCGELLRQCGAYLAAAYNYDAHTAPPIFYTEWRRAPMKRPPPAGRIPRPCYYWIIAFRRRKSNMQSTVLKTF